MKIAIPPIVLSLSLSLPPRQILMFPSGPLSSLPPSRVALSPSSPLFPPSSKAKTLISQSVCGALCDGAPACQSMLMRWQHMAHSLFKLRHRRQQDTRARRALPFSLYLPLLVMAPHADLLMRLKPLSQSARHTPGRISNCRIITSI